MCGIVGCSRSLLDDPKFTNLESDFLYLQKHRGPDSSDKWFGNHFAFFHQRLALIDSTNNGNQPFYNDKYVLCFNGEIYNFLQLKSKLSTIQFKSTSDTEVLFYYLIQFGLEKTLQDIQGMFAFSFYDIEKNELYLARDRFGIKPLYYFQKGNQFAFASEARTLARALKIKPDSFKTLMALHSTAEGSTTFSMFNEINVVETGTYLKLKGNQLEQFSYFKLENYVNQHRFNESNKMSKNAILDEFDSLLNQSVKEMLVSDFKMGSFVSGGIDSSIITGIAKQYNSNLSLFTADIKGKYSEYLDAKMLADSLNLNLFKTEFESNDFLNNWVTATEYNSAPKIYFTNGIPISQVAKLARQNNVKAVLCGEGSDEMFLGYSKLMAQRYKKPLLLPYNLIKKLYKIYPALNNYLFPQSFNNLNDYTNRLANGFKEQMLVEKGNEVYHFVPKSKQKYYVDSFEMMQKHLHALFHRNDRMGMIHSIEVRFPFLHEELVKFAVNLPLEYKARITSKFHNKKHPFITDKWIVREVSKKYLPKELVAKKKNGLPIGGLNAIQIGADFFKNGYVASLLNLTNNALDYMIKNENPYFIGKLASVEIFGLLYDYNLSPEQIQEKINRYCKIK